jgi:hypothetical protein
MEISDVFIAAGGILVGFAISGIFLYSTILAAKNKLLGMMSDLLSEAEGLRIQYIFLKALGAPVQENIDNLNKLIETMRNKITEWKKTK